MSDLPVMDHCLLLLRGIRRLHERGLERTRFVSGMAPSGMYWRLTIIGCDDVVVDDPLGQAIRAGTTSVSWTSGVSPEFGGQVMTSRTTPDDVADVVLTHLPEATLRGDDPAYTRWYAGLLAECERVPTVPVAFSDSWTPHGWQVGFGGPAHPSPPTPLAQPEPLGRLDPPE